MIIDPHKKDADKPSFTIVYLINTFYFSPIYPTLYEPFGKPFTKGKKAISYWPGIVLYCYSAVCYIKQAG
jgi:hypothetical protein